MTTTTTVLTTSIRINIRININTSMAIDRGCRVRTSGNFVSTRGAGITFPLGASFRPWSGGLQRIGL
jgi:hypothetical protein